MDGGAMRQPARKLAPRQQVTQVEDPEFGTLLELPAIDIEGDPDANVLPFSEEEARDIPMRGHNPNRRRRPVTELEPIDIQGSRSADVEPFDMDALPKFSDEPAFVPGAQEPARRADGVSTMLPEWVPPWATEVAGQPVRGMGGTTDYQMPEWLGEMVADSEGQMPDSVMGAAAAMLPNAAFPPYMLYRQFAGQEPTADERTGSPMAALAGMADSASLGASDELSALFGDDPEVYRREMQTTQRQNPGSFAVGEAAGMAPQMFIPSAAAGRGSSTAARAGLAALEGATYGGVEGMARSNAPTFMGRVEDAVPGAVLGGVMGGALGAASSRAERRAAEPVDQRAVERALDQAALERLGQAGGSQSLSSSRMRMIAPGSTPREQVASARRTVARMHEYGAFDGVLPPGPEVIAQRVDAQRTRGLENMDRVAEAMSGEQVEAQRVLTHLQDRIDSLDSIPGAETEAGRMRALLDRFQTRVDQGPLSMSDLQAWKSHYQRRYDPNSSSVPQEEAGDLLRSITGNMQDAVTNVDPVLGQRYQQGRHDEFIGRGFDEMLGHQTMDAARLRKFSLSDYMTGLAGFSGENGGIVRGLIGIAANRGLRRNEHGLAAMSLERTARRLQQAPQRFGRQAAMLQAALKRGPQAFAAALYIAQQNDEAVRAAMAEEEDVAGMRERAVDAVPTMDAAIEEDINSIPTMDDL